LALTSRFSVSSTRSSTSSTGRRRVIAAVHLDQLTDRQVTLNPALLKHDSHSLTQPAPAVGGIHPEYSGFPGTPGAVTLEDLDGGGLARSVGTEKAEDLAPSDLEADASYGLDLAVGLTQIAHRNGELFRLQIGS